MAEARANGNVVPIEALLDDRHLLDALLEYSPDHIYFKDRNSRFLRVSRSLAEWMGLSDPLQAIGCSDADFFAVEHARKALVDEDVILRTGHALVSVEEREVWPDGRETWVSTTKAPLRDRKGDIIGIFGMSRDVTARKAAENLVAEQAVALAAQAQQLRDLAARDELTGLLNRRGFFDAAEPALQGAVAEGRACVMYFIDIDCLKQINDTFGHAVGDQALVVVADALRTLADARRLVGRIGGDEFCIFETTSQAGPQLSEAGLQATIAARASAFALPFTLSASIGRVHATDGDDLAQLIARSDDKMYARKARRASRRRTD